LNIVLFIFYVALFSYLITIIPFVKKSQLGGKTLITLFLIKVIAGIGYAFFYQLPAYYTNSDTYRFFNYSLQETDTLLHSPIQFIRDLFSFEYSTSGNLFVGDNSYWNDLKSNIIIKLLAICNIFSFKSYYTNIIFFNFFFFFGVVAFYRFIQEICQINKWIIIGIVFLTPSFLFWCSGVHKDGLIFTALGLIFWLFQQCIKFGFNSKKITILFVLLLLLFGLRNYVCLSVLPCMFCWYLSHIKKTIQPFFYFYCIAIVVFFSTSLISTQNNFPKYIVTKQQEFKQLSGGSSISTNNLEPTVKSFIYYLPKALDVFFFRPHISEIKNKSYIPAIIENIATFLLLIGCLLFKKKKVSLPNSLWACLFFGCTMLLITAYSITFSGAIVRYKSIVLPFLIIPFLAITDFNKLKLFFKQNIYKYFNS
jgi:hypothetical protein